ncbi:MAG: arsenite methyltransferase [Candidatus Krumholzibacteria bacterium]|nr:arsenite methyltransferase [Candidatus Krumholzibacteria bacterium]
MDKDRIRRRVRERYGEIAEDSCSCRTGVKPCCGDGSSAGRSFFEAGYSQKDLEGVPEGSVVGLACGNPLSFAEPVAGETVLDLGSGPGLDCFIAAKAVGETGRVIGVDMTPEMIDKARRNAHEGGYENVEFRLGEIENLPAADDSIDIIISNCVVNLSPDKARVFREAFRVLRPAGRLVVSDVVLLEPLPDELRESEDLLVGCVANAEMKEDYIALIGKAGFLNVAVLKEKGYSVNGREGKGSAASITVRGMKPRTRDDSREGGLL